MTAPPLNIPNPDPSIIANERLAEALLIVNDKIKRNREESKCWVESLQLLLEQKITGAEDKTSNLDRVVQTRLAGSETALNAAMAAADKVTQKIETNSVSVLNELKQGMGKQFDSMNEKIEDLKKRVFESGGRSQGIGATGSMIISAIAALAAIASVFIVLSRPDHQEPQSSIQHQRVSLIAFEIR